MTVTVTNAGQGWLAAGSNFTMPFTPVTGRTLVVVCNHEAALNGITGITDSGGNTWLQDYTGTAPAGEGRRVFRCQTIGTVPTWLKVNSSTAGTIMYWVFEVTDLHASPFESATPVTDGTTTTSHSAAFTAVDSNCVALVSVIAAVDAGTITPTNGFTEVATSRNGRSGFYKADIGASGSKTLTYTTSALLTQNHLIVVYKSAVSDPTVSTVTGTTVTEGGNIVFTVTLSGATNRSTTYPASFTGGTATAVDDYDDNLSHTGGHATYSDGVLFSGSDLVVPSGVSSFTVTIATTQDALDEDNETLVLRVGGVDSTGGAITDDDAVPTISVNDATENAGEVIFTVSLSAASGKSITVDYATANGTSTAGVDYTTKTGTLTFAAGETTKTVTVTVP